MSLQSQDLSIALFIKSLMLMAVVMATHDMNSIDDFGYIVLFTVSKSPSRLDFPLHIAEKPWECVLICILQTRLKSCPDCRNGNMVEGIAIQNGCILDINFIQIAFHSTV